MADRRPCTVRWCQKAGAPVERAPLLNLAETSVSAYLRLLSSAEPVPGGGCAAALSGAQGASLVAMLARAAMRRSEQEEAASRLEQLARRADELGQELAALAAEEAEAYHHVMRAYRLPRSTERERGSRSEAVRQALARAAEVPLRAVRAAVDTLELLVELLPTVPTASLPDAGSAGWLLRACVESSALHVRASWRTMGPDATESRSQLEVLVGHSRRLFEQLRARLGPLSNGGQGAF